MQVNQDVRQNIVFTGGGTGGHVFPAIALIQTLRERVDFRLIWLGSAKGIERSIVEGLGWEYRVIPTGKLRRYFSWKNFTDLFRILGGYWRSRSILAQLKPRFVFSKGGFVSVPPVRAAHGLGIPVYSHESDLDPGLATRLNLKASRLLFVAYEKTRDFVAAAHRGNVVVSGNPVRKEFFAPAAPTLSQLFAAPAGAPVLLVLGGSLGALQVNQLLTQALPALAGRVFVVHQTGAGWQARPDTEWYVSRPFFSTEMPALMQGASLVFGRAGAGTLWEAAACETPLLLLPLGSGSRGDQVRNAEYFAQRGAARVLSDAASGESLAELVVGLTCDAEALAAMKAALRGFGAQGASDRIADALSEVLSSPGEVRRV